MCTVDTPRVTRVLRDSLYCMRIEAEVGGCERHETISNNFKLIVGISQVIHWFSMVRAGLDERPVRSMEARVGRSRLNLFDANLG